MVVDRQPGTEPEGPHGLGLLSGSQMSLKPRIGSNRVRAWIRVRVVKRITMSNFSQKGASFVPPSKPSSKLPLWSLREMGVDDGAGSGQWGNGFGEACSGCGGKGSLRTGVAVLVVKGGRRWDYYSGKRWG
ncbi:hypothetical protein V6N12_038700 [Hibiscus sabdariffa]|uniref:Uncharacterized protein n=1 Tax=Hibiscus sabdariffa TaxID=183260 RepID=A0ABR2CAL1_9ROSI